jgi:hypothetical protein
LVFAGVSTDRALAQPTPSPTPSPAPITGAASGERDRDEYRTYVFTVTVDGSNLVAALSELRTCNGDRAACRHALASASDSVAAFEKDLDANPSPACLAATDSALRTALEFYDRGLHLVEDGSAAQDRLRVTQGAILLAVGTWKLGAAVRAARRSSCD